MAKTILFDEKRMTVAILFCPKKNDHFPFVSSSVGVAGKKGGHAKLPDLPRKVVKSEHQKHTKNPLAHTRKNQSGA
jgi:hypothetical protein